MRDVILLASILFASYIHTWCVYIYILISGSDCRYYTLINKVSRGLDANCKLDIFLVFTNAVLLSGEYDWSNVLVLGEYT